MVVTWCQLTFLAYQITVFQDNSLRYQFSICRCMVFLILWYTYFCMLISCRTGNGASKQRGTRIPCEGTNVVFNSFRCSEDKSVSNEAVGNQISFEGRKFTLTNFWSLSVKGYEVDAVGKQNSIRLKNVELDLFYSEQTSGFQLKAFWNKISIHSNSAFFYRFLMLAKQQCLNAKHLSTRNVFAGSTFTLMYFCSSLYKNILQKSSEKPAFRTRRKRNLIGFLHLASTVFSWQGREKGKFRTVEVSFTWLVVSTQQTTLIQEKPFEYRKSTQRKET